MALQGGMVREGTATVRADGAPRCLPGNQPGFAGFPPTLPFSGCFLRWENFLLFILLSGSGFYQETEKLSIGFLCLPIHVKGYKSDTLRSCQVLVSES